MTTITLDLPDELVANFDLKQLETFLISFLLSKFSDASSEQIELIKQIKILGIQKSGEAIL